MYAGLIHAMSPLCVSDLYWFHAISPLLYTFFATENTEFVKSPDDITTVTTRILPSGSTSQQPNVAGVTLSCDVRGYVAPDVPTIWTKDDIYIAHTYGLNLDLSAVRKSCF